jgi:hypothetical protein
MALKWNCVDQHIYSQELEVITFIKLKNTVVVIWPKLMIKFSFLLVLRLFYFYNFNLIYCLSNVLCYCGLKQQSVVLFNSSVSHYLLQLQSKTSKRRSKRKGRTYPLLKDSDSMEWANLTPKSLWTQIKSELKGYYDWDLQIDSLESMIEQFCLQKISLLRYMNNSQYVAKFIKVLQYVI